MRSANLLLFCCFFVVPGFSQVTDTTDIFDVDEQGMLALKPGIHAGIMQAIEPVINQRMEAHKLEKARVSGGTLSKEDIAVLGFTEDTIRIAEYLNEYENYPGSTTTIGMKWYYSYSVAEYDKLLNKYYREALSRLQPAMKKRLIRSQKKWLDYYLSEKEFLFEINYFGNHNSYLYSWPAIQHIMEERVIFLFSIVKGEMYGSDTYIDE